MSMEALEMMVKQAKHLVFCRPAKSGGDCICWAVVSLLWWENWPVSPAGSSPGSTAASTADHATQRVAYLPPPYCTLIMYNRGVVVPN